MTLDDEADDVAFARLEGRLDMPTNRVGLLLRSEIVRRVSMVLIMILTICFQTIRAVGLIVALSEFKLCRQRSVDFMY